MQRWENKLKNVRAIAVIGASGGIGTTTAGIGLALHHARDVSSLLVDIESLSGLEITLAIEQQKGLRWHDLHGARGHIDTHQLLRLLPQFNGIPILSKSCQKEPEVDTGAVEAFLQSCKHSELSIVALVDSQSLKQFLPFWDAVIVVTPVTLMGAARSLEVKNLAGDIPIYALASGIADVDITDTQYAHATKIPLIAHLPRSKSLRDSQSLGLGPLAGPARRYRKFLEVTRNVIDVVCSMPDTEKAALHSVSGLSENLVR